MGDLRGRRPGARVLRLPQGRAQPISAAFRPILGDRVDGPIGRAIDILAIFATLFGSATSLGLGALQINSGMDFLWGTPADGIAVAIIAVLTRFVVSAVSGVHRGIQWLSNTNMVLAICCSRSWPSPGRPSSSSTRSPRRRRVRHEHRPRLLPDRLLRRREWLAGWTIFYWAWWISWAPFVGTFIARISRGRTIREFVLGVLLVPSGVSFVWFAILGGAAIDLQLSGDADISGAVGRARRPRSSRRSSSSRWATSCRSS